jgi:outer membrane protein
MHRNLLPLLLAAVLWSSRSQGVGTNAMDLTRREAEARALRAHPRITVSELRQLIAREGVIEARSPLFPNLSGNATVVGVDGDNNRIAAGGLNNPVIYDRGAFGLYVTWQLYDFGRTARLLEGARLRAQAAGKAVEATRAQVVFLVDTAFLSTLRAQTILTVADQTVRTRQVLRDQVEALATNKLKSSLDLGFAETTLAEGRLLLSQAANALRAERARLASLIGERGPWEQALAAESPGSAVTPDTERLVAEALEIRPELAQLRLELSAAEKAAAAERASAYPTLGAFGAGGVVPDRNPHLPDNYFAAGLNLNIPLFDGLGRDARRRAAALRARAAAETLREEEENTVREVRIAALNVINAIERTRLTDQFVATATESFSLAEARYKAGTASLAELGQAQLSKTTAEIAGASARYELDIQQATLDFLAGGTSRRLKEP